MTKQTVNIGNNANDGSGDPARSAFTKINQNFDELYSKTNNLGSSSSLNSTQNNVDLTQGVAMKSGDYGIGLYANGDLNTLKGKDLNNIEIPTGLYSASDLVNSPASGWLYFINWCLASQSNNFKMQLATTAVTQNPTMYVRGKTADGWGSWNKLYATNNTTVDGNGYLKPSSPVVRLYADKIELINEAVGQPITFEKLGVGNYLVKNTTGLRDNDGWYIETPKDLNGNILVFVEYTQLENKDISVKTYKKKFDMDTASTVADHDNPMDIPTDRWVDLRFNDYPVPEQQTTPEATS